MLLADCARFVCSLFYGWLVAWTVKWLVATFISKYHYHLPLQLACICFKPRFHIRTLVDRIHANSVAPVRQDLQTKVTNAFAQLNTGAPIVRKETVGKKHFSFGEIFLWKSLPHPLSYLSMNPTVSPVQPAIRPSAPPDVRESPYVPPAFLSICLTKQLAV